MLVQLTPREISVIMSWRAGTFWPDEERLLRKLQRALDADAALDLSRWQLQVLLQWTEEQAGGHYGTAAVNPEERSIMEKLSAALQEKG